MVWKQDLAKLKQAFPEVGGPSPPPPKPKVKPVEVKNLNEEDAFFLAAMGTPAPRPALVQVAAPPVQVQAPPRVDTSFDQELSDLKGLKPLTRNPILAPMPEAVPSPAPAKGKAEAATGKRAPEPPAIAVVQPTEPPAPRVVVESDPAKGPVRIHLAAGMALEVDATLDLRNHSIPDALGRLRDRLEDGAHMGWRTLHVVLGEDEALHNALLAFLGSGRPLKITRYAQAPIPMGGAQAWVLYY